MELLINVFSRNIISIEASRCDAKLLSAEQKVGVSKLKVSAYWKPLLEIVCVIWLWNPFEYEISLSVKSGQTFISTNFILFWWLLRHRSLTELNERMLQGTDSKLITRWKRYTSVTANQLQVGLRAGASSQPLEVRVYGYYSILSWVSVWAGSFC